MADTRPAERPLLTRLLARGPASGASTARATW